MREPVRMPPRRLLVLLLVAFVFLPVVQAEEWATWRGPRMKGVSAEKGLISNWSLEGENLIWRDDFSGRSIPVVFDGRVCAIGRIGEEITRRETVVCWTYREHHDFCNT